MFALLVKVHPEGGKHLVRVRLFVELKQHYTGFPRYNVLAFIKSYSVYRIQKCNTSLNSTVVKPLHSPDFAYMGQVDIIDLQSTSEVNRPYNFLLVYEEEITKFVFLRKIERKTAEEVVNQLSEILCLLSAPHIPQCDNGRELKNINLSKMIREFWPGYSQDRISETAPQ